MKALILGILFFSASRSAMAQNDTYTWKCSGDRTTVQLATDLSHAKVQLMHEMILTCYDPSFFLPWDYGRGEDKALLVCHDSNPRDDEGYSLVFLEKKNKQIYSVLNYAMDGGSRDEARMNCKK